MSGPGRALRVLAKEYGVRPSRRESGGNRLRAGEETLVELLRLLGAPISRVADAEPALREARSARAARMLEPVVVLWDGAPARVGVRLPASLADRGFTVVVERDGEVPVELERGRCRVSAPRRDVSGFVAMILDLPIRFGFGIHRLLLDVGGRRATSTVVAAPSRITEPAPGEQRRWGVVAVLAQPRGPTSAPGDLSGLERLGERIAAEGGRVVGTTDLAARFGGRGAEPRYAAALPASRRFWDEGVLALDALPERSDVDAVPRQELLVHAALAVRDRPAREAELRRWLEQNPSALEYAAFRAAVERAGPSGRTASSVGLDDLDDDRVRYHAYLQWEAERQLRDVGARLRGKQEVLLGTFPAGLHPDGFDVASNPGLYVTGARVEPAPEEDPRASLLPFGFPPIGPDASREQGHRHLLACVEAHLRHFDVLTIDRVAGLHRQWWVPAGADTSAGAFVQYPADELYAVLCLAASRRNVLVAGEDPGRLPHEVARALQQHRFFTVYDVGRHVEPDDGDTLPAPARRTIATTGDAGWRVSFTEMWHGLDPQRRGSLVARLRGAGLLDTAYGEVLDVAEVLEAVVELLGHSRSELVLLGLDDLAALEPARRVLRRLDGARAADGLEEIGVGVPRVDQAT